MSVSDKLGKLYEEIRKITEKSCDNCQEFNCDFCPFECEDDERSEE